MAGKYNQCIHVSVCLVYSTVAICIYSRNIIHCMNHSLYDNVVVP